MKWILTLILPATLMATTLDRVLDVQQGLLAMNRNESLQSLSKIYPNHTLSKQIESYLKNPTKDKEAYFKKLKPSDPFEERVQEVFKNHEETAKQSKERLLREGLVDIEVAE